MADDSYELVTVRIYRRDWRILLKLQAEQAQQRRKPSMADVIRDQLAVRQAEEKP